jgi:hypothetical protein
MRDEVVAYSCRVDVGCHGDAAATRDERRTGPQEELDKTHHHDVSCHYLIVLKAYCDNNGAATKEVEKRTESRVGKVCIKAVEYLSRRIVGKLTYDLGYQ